VAEHNTSVGEMRHAETALHSLENKLANVRRFVPRSGRKRGFINAGVLILKSLFDTAMMIDLDEFHETVDELSRKQDDVAHSLDKQVSYFKQI
jgi:hypothetical protein